VTGEQGYTATRVADVLERTGISRRTFYIHFDNLEQCFFAAHDRMLLDLRELLDEDTCEPDGATLGSILERVLAHFARWPSHARVLLIEVLSAGPRGVERYEQTVAMLAARLADCANWQPGPCDALGRIDMAQAAVGAMLRVVQLNLLKSGAETLPGLLPGLLALTTRVGVAV
jgi:AcrR family transcriptional regulator